jgi:hypothetical protein
MWISQYLNYSPQPNKDPDFNNDGEVDGGDFVMWLQNFGSWILLVAIDIGAVK